MPIPPGKWRLDVVMMGLYQLALFFAAQLIFTIFLDYMPKTRCDDDNYCYKLKDKCLQHFEKNATNLCDKDDEAFDECLEDKNTLYFQSAQFDYQQDCTDLTYYNSTTNMYIGVLLANLILGVLADKLGRRPVYIISLTIGVVSLILSAAVPGVVAFYIFRFTTGIGVAGAQIVGWSYGSELISPHRRLQLRTFSNWANARLIVVFVAFISREWRMASYCCAVISAFILPILYIVPESPVFLEQKNRTEEAKEARRRCAEICGIEFVEDSDLYTQTSLKRKTKKKPMKSISFMDMFQNTRLKTNFLVLCFMWFYIGMTTYITDLNGADMSKNLFVGQFLAGLLLTISKITLGLVEPHFEWLGRRIIFLFSQGVALLAYSSLLLALYADSKETNWYLFSYLCAYTFQALSTETCYLSAAELMPTDIRVTATAFFNISLRIGTIVASTTKQLKFWYEPALFWINLVVGIVGITTVYLKLEESRNVNLQNVGQDDVEEENEKLMESDESMSGVEKVNETEKSIKSSEKSVKGSEKSSSKESVKQE